MENHARLYLSIEPDGGISSPIIVWCRSTDQSGEEDYPLLMEDLLSLLLAPDHFHIAPCHGEEIARISAEWGELLADIERISVAIAPVRNALKEGRLYTAQQLARGVLQSRFNDQSGRTP